MEYLIYLGMILVVGSFVILTYLSFKQSILWGIICFIISPLPFSFVYWKETKKYLGVMAIGIFCLVGVYISVEKPSADEQQEAVDMIFKAIRELQDDGKFSANATGALGSLTKCEETADLSYSFNFNSKYPVTWTGIIECRFIHGLGKLELVVKEIKLNEWEIMEVVIHESES